MISDNEFMPRSAPEKWMTVFLIALVISVVSYVAYRFYTMKPMLGEEVRRPLERLQEKQDRYDEVYNQAMKLSQSGQHKKAAFLLLDLAGEEHINAQGDSQLRPDSATIPSQPHNTELVALEQFDLAGPELGKAYLRLLKTRYPDWRRMNGQPPPVQQNLGR